MNILIIAFVLSALGAAYPVALQTQPVDSLVRIAVARYPSVEALRLAAQQADARARSAAAWEAPRIGVEISMIPPSDINPVQRGETMFMVEQMVPLFGQNRVMARAMSAGAAVSEAEMHVAQRELRARIEREYYTLWLIDRRVELNAQSRKIAEQMYRAAEASYEVGRAAQSDLLTADVEIQRLATELRLIAEERIEATTRLNALLGRSAHSPLTIDSILPQPMLPTVDAIEEQLAVHPALQKMDAMAAMNRAEAEAREAMQLPMLMVRGGVSYMPEGHPVREANITAHGVAGSEEGIMRFGLTAGAMLSLPIAPWSSAAASAQAEVARLQARETEAQRAAMLDEMRTMLYSAHAEARRAAVSIEYTTATLLPLLTHTQQTLQNDYATGRVPFAAVLNGYTMLLMAHMDVYMKRMEYAMAFSMIEQLTGDLQ